MLRSLSIFPQQLLLATLVCLLYTGNSLLKAQANTLKLCSETLYKNSQKIRERKNADLQPLFPTLDPTYRKLEGLYQDWTACVKGQKAPLSTFKTLNGEVYDAGSLTGKIVVVNFWFMSCGPCRLEMPALNKLVEEYNGKNVLFIGFTTDKAERLKPAFFEQNRFDFKVVAESQPIANSFHIMGYPTTYIVDQKGIIRQAWIGLGGSTDKLAPYHKAKAAIDQLLVNK